ncbi:MAG: hypothetical protein R3Y24_03330 [Eubacteriales bacterium]
MMNNHNQLKELLQEELKIPVCVDEKIRDAYTILGINDIDIEAGKDKSVICEEKKNKYLKMKKAVMGFAAAMILCITLPIGVLAANGYFTVLFSKEEPVEEQIYDKGVYTFNEDMKLTEQKISFSLTQIPNGYEDMIGVIANESVTMAPSIKIEKYVDDVYISSIAVTLYSENTFIASFLEKTYCTLDMTNHTLLFPNIVEQEEMQVGENYISILSNQSNQKHGMFFNQTAGYIGELFVDGEVEDIDIEHVIEGISVTMTEKVESKMMTESEIEQALAEGLEIDDDILATYMEANESEEVLLQSDMKSIGDTFQVETFYALEESERGILDKRIDRVQVFEQLDREVYGIEHMIPWEENAEFIREDGTLEPAIRNIVDEEGNIIGTEEVELVWIAFDVTVENQTNQTLEYNVAEPLAAIEKMKDGNYRYVDSLDYRELQRIPYLKSPAYLSEIDSVDIEQIPMVDLSFIHIAPQSTLQYTMISMIEKEALEGELLLSGNVVY